MIPSKAKFLLVFCLDYLWVRQVQTEWKPKFGEQQENWNLIFIGNADFDNGVSHLQLSPFD